MKKISEKIEKMIFDFIDDWFGSDNFNDYIKLVNDENSPENQTEHLEKLNKQLKEIIKNWVNENED